MMSDWPVMNQRDVLNAAWIVLMKENNIEIHEKEPFDKSDDKEIREFTMGMLNGEYGMSFMYGHDGTVRVAFR